MILSVVLIGEFKVIGNSVSVVVSTLSMTFMNARRVRSASA